jgi:hypothetical protein
VQITRRVAAAATAAGVVLALGTAGVGEAAQSSVRATRPAQASAKYTLRIRAINRAGHYTSTQPVVLSGPSSMLSAGPQTVKVGAGRYIVGAAVATPIKGKSWPSYTLVAKEVRVTRNTTVTLDARTGRQLKVRFKAGAARQIIQGAALCDGIGAGAMLAGVYNDPTGSTYVAPVPKAVQLFYQSRWQSPAGTLYDLAGAAAPGSKAAPHFSDKVSRLAQVHLQLRTGTNATGPGLGFILDQGANCEPGGDVLPVSAPWAETDYLQAGPWTGEVGIGARTLYWSGTVKAGRHYTVSLGSAVYGPWLPFINGQLFPDLNGRTLAYGTSGFFSDPEAGSSDCAYRTTSTLLKGSTTLRRLRQTGCSLNQLVKNLARSGWYRLQVAGSQAASLSSRVDLTWRFYVHTGPQQSWPSALPVTLTEFRPSGLDLANAAPPGAHTKIAVTIVKGAYPDSPTPRNVLSTIHVEASFDGGHTWQMLKLTRSGADWVVTVHDPATGTVSLRSVVVNAKGDSTELTIYNAYAVESGTSSPESGPASADPAAGHAGVWSPGRATAAGR